jgi:hypothetical protein
VRLLYHRLALSLIFWGISLLFSIMATFIYIPTNSVQVFSILYIFTNTCYLLSFYNSHYNSVRRCFIGVLICIFLMISDFEHFSWPCWPFVCLLLKNVDVNALTIFNWVSVLLHYWSSLCISDIKPLSDVWVAWHFSPFCWLFPWLCRSFWLDAIPLVYFCFCCLCFCIISKK